MKKNVLLIEPFIPYPLTSGGHQAIFNGIAILKNIANVHLLYTHTTWNDPWTQERKQLEEIFPFVRTYNFCMAEKSSGMFWVKVKRRIHRMWAPLLNKVVKPKEDINDYRSWGFEPQPDKFAAYVNQLIRDLKIDVVQVEMCFQQSIVLDLPKDVKKVFVHHELRFVREELRLANIDVPQSFRNEVTIHKFEEIGLLNLYDEIVVLSPIDKQKLIDAGVTKPILTSFAVVNSADKPVPDENREWNHMLTFIGPEGHDPNYDGVMWFLENCWTEVREKNSDYRLRIIGKWSEGTKTHVQETYPNVEFAGFVDDLGMALAGTVMIVPLRVGSGIRMKILEAGAYGVPVVSTRVGAEGLMINEGEDLLLADDASGFVDAIIKLDEKSLREKMEENLKKRIGDKYSLEALKENRKALYF